MSAFDDLEQQLSRSVADGAAAETAPAAAVPRGGRRRKSWSAPRLFALAVLLTGVTTGALAATGVLRVAPEQKMVGLPFAPDEGPGVATGPLRVLPLRVPDPDGGPPWAIRTFATTRGSACAQVGQVYRGRFGHVERDEHGDKIFRLQGANLGDYGSRCTNRQVDGFPVLSGLRVLQIDGGTGSPERCAPAGGRAGACLVRAVTVVRFGMLGPKARSATLRADGKPVATQALAASSGHAYLFVRAVDPAPFRDTQLFDRRLHEQARHRFPAPRRRAGLSLAERRAADRAARRQIAYVMRRYDETRQERRRLVDRTTGHEVVRADFGTGRTIAVAGGSPAETALPGVPSFAPRIPADVRATVHADLTSTRAAVQVRFRSPVDMTRPGLSYAITVRGPAHACTASLHSRWANFDRTVHQGDTVTVSVPPASVQGRGHWCRGRRYSVRVRLMAYGAPPTKAREVGRTTVVAP